jgi:calcineurin-like phosphoesterase
MTQAPIRREVKEPPIVNILLCGDVMGRSGRDAIRTHLAGLKRDLGVDLAIVNAENAAAGFGLTERLAGELYEAGADILTTGNHAWDQRELISYIDRDPRILRPANFPEGTPGAGWCLHPLDGGRSVLVVNLMGRLFMDALDDPFARLQAILARHPLGRGPLPNPPPHPGEGTVGVTAIVVDFHAEATSEKMAFGHFADGRVSAVLGTHTHVPTADAQILPGGTAFISDAGMCGDYDSVIGMQKAPSVRRFVTKMPGEKPKVAEGEGTLCGVFVSVDDTTGLARYIEPVRVGGRLAPHMPRL